MKLTLKPLDEQVIVITGASSGIGLVTAKHAAQRGACVVLAARNEKDLRDATEAIRRAGGRAVYAVADVADATQVDAIADTAIREFGRIDTWVNNAAVSMYGRIIDLSIEDMRRQMDVNYWGQVYGSRTAVQHLRHDRWRADQRRQRVVRPGHPAARRLLCGQARAARRSPMRSGWSSKNKEYRLPSRW